MPNHYQAIYLAPHLDDVALSCGGQIYQRTQQGNRVLVVTVMAGDPPTALSDYAHSLHRRWELAADATAARRQEDLAACAWLGADARHGHIPDCIYRLDPATSRPFYQSDADIFGDIQPPDAVVVDEVAALLQTLPAAAEVIAPLTVGHHVDHLLVRQAAERVFGRHLTYYEDFPYVQTPNSLDFLPELADKLWRSRVVPVSEAALTARVEAILAYRSQMSTFFKDRADLERQIFGYARQVGGERLWQRGD